MYSNIGGFNFINLQLNLWQNEAQIAPKSHTSYSRLRSVAAGGARLDHEHRRQDRRRFLFYRALTLVPEPRRAGTDSVIVTII